MGKGPYRLSPPQFQLVSMQFCPLSKTTCALVFNVVAVYLPGVLAQVVTWDSSDGKLGSLIPAITSLPPFKKKPETRFASRVTDEASGRSSKVSLEA